MTARKLAILLCLLLLVVPLRGSALDEVMTAGDVLITELQTTGVNAGAETTTAEFVELYNNTDEPIDLTGWRLQISAAGTLDVPPNWTNVSLIPELGGLLQADDHLLIANVLFLPEVANHTYSSGRFTKVGGHARLVSPNSATTDANDLIVHDLLGWGTAAHPEGAASKAPPADQSLKRRLDENGFYIDTNNNYTDFIVSDEPFPEASAPVDPEPEPEPEPESEDTPEETPVPEPKPEPEPELEPEPDPEPEPEAAAVVLDSPILTELMPNPAAPATDAEDEYVELFNPNSEPFALAGFKLQTGSAFSYSVTFQGEVIPAQGYLMVYSRNTNLTLANGGGDARLLDAAGVVVAEADTYGEAEDGLSWSFIAGVWQWTATPTPGLPNVLAIITPPTLAAKTTKAVKTAKATAKKKAGAVKTTKATKATKAATTERAIYEDPLLDDVVTPVHPAILAGVGLSAVGYGLYEYRFDFQNRLQQLRRYRSARRAART